MSNKYPNPEPGNDPNRSHPGPPIPEPAGHNPEPHQPYTQEPPQNQQPTQNDAPEEKKGGALKIIGIIAAVLAAIALVAVIAVAVTGGGDDEADGNGEGTHNGSGEGENNDSSDDGSSDKGAADTGKGNYKSQDCAVQGDDMVSKLPAALKQAEEDGKSEEFRDAMKIIAFFAHNQQLTEEFGTELLKVQTVNYSGMEDFSEEDIEEVLSALDVDYEAEASAFVNELNMCFGMGEDTISKYFDKSGFYSDYDESFVTEALAGDAMAPTVQTMVAAPADVPDEYTKALEEGEKQLKNQRLTRLQLFVMLYSDLASEDNQAQTFSVDAALYAAEHVTGEFFSDKEVGDPVELDERNIGININGLVDRGYTVPEMRKRLVYKG